MFICLRRFCFIIATLPYFKDHTITASYSRTADVLIIGAGAAGLMCALTAAARGRRVILLERSSEAGKKILISGGGRCNITHLETAPERFLCGNPHFVKSALARFTPWDILTLLEPHGLTWNEKTAGQMFCDQGAKAVRNALVNECKQHGVVLRCDTDISEVRARDNGGFSLDSPQGDFACDSLVIATGGLSIPKMGATPFGHHLARQFGLPIIEPRAGLVPFTWSTGDKDAWSELSGLSTPARVTCNGVSFSENILFTHRGLSGPAILQISSYWQPGATITIDLLPGVSLGELLQAERQHNPKTTLRSVFTGAACGLPKRLAGVLCATLVEDTPLGSLSNTDIDRIAAALHEWPFAPGGTEGYRTAEVTLGGVDTAALSSKTMQVNDVAGLYFIGEVMDVTGQLGGFNFQWAWASGHAAGEAV